MEAEEQNSGYKPSGGKKNTDPKQAFLEKLDKEIEKDKEHPYVPYKDMKKIIIWEEVDIIKMIFLNKLEKEMEKDKNTPYVPYEQRKKKDNMPPPQDSNKCFLKN